MSYPGARRSARPPQDEGWHRMRSLAPALAADAINVLTVFPGPRARPTPGATAPTIGASRNACRPTNWPQRIVRGRAAADAADSGAGNRVFAAVGRVAPWLTGRVMQRTVFAKLIDATGDAQ
ncbi:MAG: hypothetical protein R3A10_17625 [Caldilineaceae bacterium]